jgi:hypothetical protein
MYTLWQDISSALSSTLITGQIADQAGFFQKIQCDTLNSTNWRPLWVKMKH